MSQFAKQIAFLQKYPHFEERPASIIEFCGPGYLDEEKRIRASVMKVLVDLFGEETNGERIALWERGMSTGAIGIGKTTLASIVLAYFAHWTLCLRDPQDYYDLMAGSRIAFMQMSTSASQAKEVVFGDVKARVENCQWFRDSHPFDPKFKNQLRFDKDIWILPGNSAETTFEGYNILAGILDEADSHQVTKEKDYAEQGYSTIESRIKSRFDDRGLLLVVGQMKKSTGFAKKIYDQFLQDPDAYTNHMTIWESKGWSAFLKPDGTRDSFFFDYRRYREVAPAALSLADNAHVMEIPRKMRSAFLTNPIKALRDLAGIPPIAGQPFIVLTDRITHAQEEYKRRYGVDSPVDHLNNFLDDWRAQDSLKRACHVDVAYAEKGDSLGFAMGHVREMVPGIEDPREMKPFIVIDLVMRIHAPPGRELFLGDIRRIIYELKDDLRFKINIVTTDSHQSTDFRQQLERKRFMTEIVSVDKDMVPYHDLQDALYDKRIALPTYMVQYRATDSELTNVVFKELSELEEGEKKIDHPPDGSKDVADALAGVVFTLMGDRRYHKRRSGMAVTKNEDRSRQQQAMRPPGFGTAAGLGTTAPIPPTAPGPSWAPPRRQR